MSKPLERYQTLGFADSFPRMHRYPIICKELSLIIRYAYSKLPKNLQALILQDTLTAFRLLPGMQTRTAVSAAHLLFQSADAALPKQKKNLAVTEFKHAMVAHRRRCKARQEEKGSAQLPQDVLVHVFSFLDMPSLISVAQVSWSWNLAASDDQLWHAQYVSIFGNAHNNRLEISGKKRLEVGVKKNVSLQKDMVTGSSIHWKEVFRRTYRGSLKKLTSSRGYCGNCTTIVWLENMKCSNEHCRLSSENHDNQRVKPVSSHQVVEYILDDSITILSSLDSDSDSDAEEASGSMSRLWAYPKLGCSSQQPSA
ncbi:F-box protein At5g52880 isoform X2 [Humulus lupulus]|uniref:F-box protein At5g52880 isoform X2 n=1 Tax=Humulus lupulus TaxID=3486 RepID=UPI002B41056C|nr:F-box protein At5g52880 isoform X2 [Humulus lupulus]